MKLESFRIRIVFDVNDEQTDEGTVKKMSVTCWVGCWYTWFGHLSNIAHRHRKSISIIETYFIDNIDFLAP